MAPQPVTITLQEPIQQGSDTITALTVRPPRAKHFRAMPVDLKTASMGHFLDMAVDLCAQPPSVIDSLGVADMTRLIEVISDFLNKGQPTGPVPSQS